MMNARRKKKMRPRFKKDHYEKRLKIEPESDLVYSHLFDQYESSVECLIETALENEYISDRSESSIMALQIVNCKQVMWPVLDAEYFTSDLGDDYGDYARLTETALDLMEQLNNELQENPPNLRTPTNSRPDIIDYVKGVETK